MADLYDSVTARDIPADAPAVGGYGNGIYRWSQADWDRFSTPYKLVISVSAGWNGGHVLDCETGDATPGECPGWIRMRQAAGLAKPCIYCNLSTMMAVQAACAGLNYSLWIAHYTGRPHSIPGAAAVQYADPAMGAGGHYDVSNITDPGWMASLGLGPAPAPDPGPPPTREGNSMYHPSGNGRWDDAVVGGNGHIYHMVTPDGNPANVTLEDWGGVGVPGTERTDWSPDGQHFMVRVVGVGSQQVYYKVVNLSGKVEQDWTAAKAAVAMTYPTGPAGPAYDDSALTGRVTALETLWTRIKTAFTS
jgi:hypothetical protein